MLTQILLDAPGTTAAKVQIAKLGDFKSGKYGKFSITRDEAEDWKRNLSLLPGQRAPIDLDHSADRERGTRRTEAAGWITDVDIDGDKVMADVEWTPVGEQAIKEKRYLFHSPTYGTWTDENGEQHKNVLQGGGLTNRPFLKMPMITLASEDRVSEWLDEDHAAALRLRMLDGEYGEMGAAIITLDDVSADARRQAAKDNNALPDGSYPIRNTGELHAAAVLAASKHGNWQAARTLIKRRARELGVDVTTLPGFGSDSPRPMQLDDIAKALGLPADSPLVIALDNIEDDGEQAAAVKAATPTAPEPPEPAKTLDQLAADEGKMVLDADTVKKLQADAAAGAEAQKQLHQERFDKAFETALKDRKVTPAEKDDLQKFYELDADLTLKTLDSRPAIMSAQPIGAPAIQFPKDAGDLPADPHDQLDTKIRQYLLDKDLPNSKYSTVLDDVMRGELTLT